MVVPNVDAADVLQAVRLGVPAKQDSELRRLGYRWQDADDHRRATLLKTVEESELHYVAELLAFIINTSRAREVRPVRAEVLGAYSADYQWLQQTFSDIAFRWPTV